jgi:hypothetical protein
MSNRYDIQKMDVELRNRFGSLSNVADQDDPMEVFRSLSCQVEAIICGAHFQKQ